MKTLIKAFCVGGLLFLLSSFVISKQPTLIAASRLDIGRRFDAYGHLSFEKERERLDNLAAQMRSETQTGSKCYIAVFGGKGRYAREARARACRAKHYLTTAGGIEAKRVIAAALTSGSEEFKVELWIWPREAPDSLITNVHQGVNITEAEVKSCGRKARRKP